MREEGTLISIAPFLLRNLLTSLYIFADKTLYFFAKYSKFLEVFRSIILSSFLFFLGILPSFFPCLNTPDQNKHKKGDVCIPSATAVGGGEVGDAIGGTGDSGIARALSQLLSLVNNIPVSSRKYEVVRSLAEKIIDDNLLEDNDALRVVNCSVLSSAFARTLSQLEAAMLDQARCVGSHVENSESSKVTAEAEYSYLLSRLKRAVKYCSGKVFLRGKSRDEQSWSAGSAMKLAAELLWLAQKMAACGCAEEAVSKWASASNLAWLSLTTEPRLQGSIVKISAFLFRQAKKMVVGRERDDQETIKEQHKQIKVKLLLLWIPLLCRASMGTDAPVLSLNERAELERVLEDIVGALDDQENQEKVLSLWLHHFTYCPSSDWPNLRSCYTSWCTASRRSLIRSKS